MFKKCFSYPTNMYVLAKFWHIIYPIKISGDRLCPPHHYSLPLPGDFQTFAQPCITLSQGRARNHGNF